MEIQAKLVIGKGCTWKEILDQNRQSAHFRLNAKFFVKLADKRACSVFAGLNAPTWQGPEFIIFEAMQKNGIATMNDRRRTQIESMSGSVK